MKCFFGRNLACWACGAVQNLVSRESRSADEQADPEAIQLALVDLVHSLVDEGLAVVGDRTQAGFVPWTIPLVDGLDGREGWLRLTRKAAQRPGMLAASRRGRRSTG